MPLYLTAILPPTNISEEIDSIRKEISEQHKVYAALKPPVHITLYRPVNIPLEMEGYLIKLLKPVSDRHSPFSQVLENYDSFNNKTLFITPIKNQEITHLQRDVVSVFNKNKIDQQDLKGNSGFHPHITIAYRDVTPELFKLLWTDFKNRKFKRSFITDHFSLLKHDGTKWNLLENFYLRKQQDLSLF